MVLSDRDIKAYKAAGKLSIEPWQEDCVEPSSVDVHLGDNFLLFDSHTQAIIDPKKGVSGLMRRIDITEKEPLILHPREFVLGTTSEWIEVGDELVARLEGKSSLGRMGLIIHSTAGYVDPGFKGQLTLEISNIANLPIILYPGMKIGQVSFMKLSSTAEFPYGHPSRKSHYSGQKGATAAAESSVWGKK